MKTFTFCLLVLFASLGIQAQNIITVDNNFGHNAQFSDLQQAIDNATAGDILYVHHSLNSYGDISIDRPLSIIGRSSSDEPFVTVVETVDFGIGSSGSRIEGMDIDQINIGVGLTLGTDLSVQNIEILNNNIRNGISSVFMVGNNSSTPSPFINNILIRGNVIPGFVGFNEGSFNIIISNNILRILSVSQETSTAITNNIFVVLSSSTDVLRGFSGNILTASNNVFITNDSSITEIGILGNYQLNNNLTYNYASGASLDFAENGSTINNTSDSLLNTNPQFAAVDPTNGISIASSALMTNSLLFDPFNDNIAPAAGSPLIGNGLNGVDIGIFSEGFVFQNFGNAAGIPDVKITGFSSTAPANGDIQVTVQAKTN